MLANLHLDVRILLRGGLELVSILPSVTRLIEELLFEA